MSCPKSLVTMERSRFDGEKKTNNEVRSQRESEREQMNKRVETETNRKSEI